jgi:hypothetical protein
LAASTSVPTGDESQSGHAIKASILAGISIALMQNGSKASSASLEKVRAAVMSCVTDEESYVRINASKCLARIAAYSQEAVITDLLIDLTDACRLNSSVTGTGASEAGRILAMAGIIQTAGNRGVEMKEVVWNIIKKGFIDERIPVRISCCQ